MEDVRDAMDAVPMPLPTDVTVHIIEKLLGVDRPLRLAVVAADAAVDALLPNDLPGADLPNVADQVKCLVAVWIVNFYAVYHGAGGKEAKKACTASRVHGRVAAKWTAAHDVRGKGSGGTDTRLHPSRPSSLPPFFPPHPSLTQPLYTCPPCPPIIPGCRPPLHSQAN